MKFKTFSRLASMALSLTLAVGLMTGFTYASAASTWTTDPTAYGTNVHYSEIYENYCQNGITVDAIMTFLRAEMPQYNDIDDALLTSIATILCEDIARYAPKTTAEKDDDLNARANKYGLSASEVYELYQQGGQEAFRPYAQIKSDERYANNGGIRPTGESYAYASDMKMLLNIALEYAENHGLNHFDDVPDDAWYAEAVNAMAATGLVNGKGDGKFCPDDPITVGEWCTVLMRIATYDGAYLTKNNWRGSDGAGYTHWAAPAVYAAHAGGFTGCWEKNVDELVNRGEAITGIMQLIEMASDLDAAPNYVLNSHNPFVNTKYTEVINNIIATNTSVANYKTWTLNDIPDHDAIMANNGSWTTAHACWADSIVQAYNWGIVHGSDTNGTFYPTSNITRAEACQMLCNAGLTWRLDIVSRKSSEFDFMSP